MADVDKDTKCLSLLKLRNVNGADLVQDLRDSNATIDMVQKKLKDYLETKRQVFPRKLAYIQR